MSFLYRNNSELLSVRITNKGRKGIAQGNFNISYFQVGDSEYVYNVPFNQMDGLNGRPCQNVFSPFDHNNSIKYPYKLDDTISGTTYGNPIQNSETITLRNVMGPAGFVSDYFPYEYDGACTGTKMKCPTINIDNGTVNGYDYIDDGSNDLSDFADCEFVTLAFIPLDCSDTTIQGTINSLIYKVISVDGTRLYLDRPTPDLSSQPYYVELICNKCSIEYPTEPSSGCIPTQVENNSQHDPWTLNVIWGENPIGYDQTTNTNLTGYTSNKLISTKQLLGYTTSEGQLDNTTTSYVNSFGESVIVTPEEQRCIAVIHYSELGDTVYDPERFYKYDDYISTDDDASNSLYTDYNDQDLTDKEYFEVFIPFILYERNPIDSIGARFFMDGTDYYITTPSTILEGTSQLKYRYLIDEQNVRVGKIFYENRTIVFDDQELVAILDYRYNRRYTLPAPKLSLTPSDQTASNSLLSGTTGQTIWITYALDSIPCNYYTKIQGTTIPTNVSLKFDTGSFKFMGTDIYDISSSYYATSFITLVQETATGQYPTPDEWKYIIITGTSTPINPTYLTNKSFTITKQMYDDADIYNLNDFTSPTYFTDYKFGEEQPFPGSVRFVRATDIEEMNYSINLPSSQFTETQNPTYTSGDKKITEVALLDSNKEVLVIGKTSVPITRSGTQVLQVKIDF